MSRELSFGQIVWIRPYRRRFLSRHKTRQWKCCKDAGDDDRCSCGTLYVFLRWLLLTYRLRMPEEERHALRFCIVHCDFLSSRLFSGVRCVKSIFDSNPANHPAWFPLLQQAFLHYYGVATDPEDREIYKGVAEMFDLHLSRTT